MQSGNLRVIRPPPKVPRLPAPARFPEAWTAVFLWVVGTVLVMGILIMAAGCQTSRLPRPMRAKDIEALRAKGAELERIGREVWEKRKS